MFSHNSKHSSRHAFFHTTLVHCLSDVSYSTLLFPGVQGTDVKSELLADIERKYVISLAVVGTLMMILLVLVFVLLYLKLKQRHAASWSVAGADAYCKCPLFLSHSPTLPNSYSPAPTPIVKRFHQPYIDTNLKAEVTLDECKTFLDKDSQQDSGKDSVEDFVNEDKCENIESNCKYKNWANV